MKDKPFIAFVIFRSVVCLMLFIHGAERFCLWEKGIPAFGQYLNEKGFLFGNFIAGAITLLETGGAVLIALGKYLKWLIPLFIIYLLMGIIMVHIKNGWFVVGSSVNGIEYNVLLISCLLFIWYQSVFLMRKI
ncbi:DoxX family protein [Ferruginibacter profundus]